jgi:hypothetical protein
MSNASAIIIAGVMISSAIIYSTGLGGKFQFLSVRNGVVTVGDTGTGEAWMCIKGKGACVSIGDGPL